MKRPLIFTFFGLIIFVAGLLIGTAVTDHYWNSYFKLMGDFHSQAQVAQAEGQARFAYFHQPPVVADWELSKYIVVLTKSPPGFTGENGRQTALFAAYGRLAITQAREGVDSAKTWQKAGAVLKSLMPASPGGPDEKHLRQMFESLDEKQMKDALEFQPHDPRLP
ncbi:MAG: hypothetical protein QM796_12155 [Chthoniobacteraceae bacterium]